MRCKREKNTKIIIRAIVFLCFCCSFAAAQTKTAAVNSQKIEKLLAESADALQAGDFVRAKSALREVLAAAPHNAAANTLAGIVAEKENDPAMAEKYFALAAKSAPNAPETRNNYGAILFKSGRKKEAAGEFAASLAVNPNQASALVNLAQIRIGEGNSAAARELFEKAKTIAPDTEILRALILISLGLGEKDRAVREFAEYIAASKTESSANANGSKNNDISFAEALLAGGLTGEAKIELESVFAGDKRNAGALVLLSKIFIQQKNIAAAGRLLESAVAGGLEDAKIYAALADVYEAGGYFENAIPVMRRAIAKEPENDFYRSRYGLLLVNSKAPAAAVIRLNEALREFPTSARLWFALGIAQFEDNKLTEAQQAFEKALSIDPKLIPALAYSGAVLVEKAQYAEAATVYERAVAVNGKVALLHYLLADTLLKMTSIDEKRIEASLKRAVALDADLTSAHLTLGRLYFRQSRWSEAAVSFEKAVGLEPERAETFYQLGRVYARLKRAADSQTALANFKRINDSQKQQKEVDRRELVRRLANVRF